MSENDQRRGSGEHPTSPLSDHDVTTPLGDESASRGISSFRAGEVIASRYRIVRLVGEGGMGEVYEAYDLELQEAVALKTIRAHAVADERNVVRFRREVQLARKVTHPNVSRIFDVATHSTADAAGRSHRILFVTMELLRGETLSDRLVRGGRLTTAEALPLIQQICAGLQAAHEAGVVHRDFKSANVMLVDDERSGGTRAVVTDFGLARHADDDVSLTQSGQVLGTPAYMAPEQVESGAVTFASDIYALGVVMFEMLSAALPFEGTTPIALAVARLQRPPRSLRDVVKEADTRWDAVIQRCLARDPADRFSSAREVALALVDTTVPTTIASNQRRQRRLLKITAAAVLLVAIAGFTLQRWWSGRQTGAKPSAAVDGQAAVQPRRTVAVLGFRDLSGSAASSWLSTAFAEMLTSEVASSDDLRAIGGDEIARAVRDLELTDADALIRAESLQRLRAQVAADYVITGSYVALGSGDDRKIRLDVRLHDPSGQKSQQFSEEGTEAGMFDLVSRTGTRLRAALGSSPTAEVALALRSSMPSSSGAARYYVDALDRLRERDALTAASLLQQAVRLQPDFALSHAALAEAWSAVGFDNRALEAARRAFELSKSLPREERLQVEARYHAASKQWGRAEEIYRSLATLYPDDLEYRLRILDMQIESSQLKEALQTVAAMRALPAPVRDDPRIDLAEAMVTEGMGEYGRELNAAKAARAKARQRGARTFEAEASVYEAWALVALGRLEEAKKAFADAESIFKELVDSGGVAKVWRKSAIALRAEGKLDEAIALTRRALERYREMGNRLGTANSLGSLGVLSSDLGRPTQARAYLAEALEIYREIGDRQNEAWALTAMANAWQREGAFDRAEKSYLESLRMSAEVGDRNQQATTAHNLAEVYEQTGRLTEAERLYQMAAQQFGDDRSGYAYAMSSLAGIKFLRGDLAGARSGEELALKERRAMKEEYTIPSSLLSLASISFEQGNAAESMKLASEALQEFVKQKRADEEALTRVHLARLHTSSGRSADAARELAAARKLVGTSQDANVRDEQLFGEAFVASSERRFDPSIQKRLVAVVKKARQRKAHRIALTGELELARLEAVGPRPAEAVSRARRLAAEAKQTGYLLIAAQAEAIRQRIRRPATHRGRSPFVQKNRTVKTSSHALHVPEEARRIVAGGKRFQMLY